MSANGTLRECNPPVSIGLSPQWVGIRSSSPYFLYQHPMARPPPGPFPTLHVESDACVKGPQLGSRMVQREGPPPCSPCSLTSTGRAPRVQDISQMETTPFGCKHASAGRGANGPASAGRGEEGDQFFVSEKAKKCI